MTAETDEVVEEGFVQGAPLPHWARPLALPPVPAAAARAAVWTRLADTQLWAGEQSGYLINRAEQINDPGSLSQVGHVSLAFNPRFQRLLLHRLHVLRGDTCIDHTATIEARLLQRESGLEQGVVSGVVTATLLVPDLRVGDTLHLTYTVEGENPIFGGRYAGWAGWDQTQPVQRRHVSLCAPKDRTIHWQWVGDRPAHTKGGERPAPQEQVHDGLSTLSFQADGLPGVPFEAYLPRDAYPLRWLQFTEFTHWSDVVAWALTLFADDTPLPASMQPLMQSLRALPSPAEQVAQALQWVQSEIRYHSLALGEGSHRPRSPATVVEQRYGDCKDKSLLLVRVLQSLGLDARPALVAAQGRQTPAKLLPSPEAFDHVVVRVRLDGEDHFVDPTRHGQSGPLEWMGQGLEDAAALVVAPGSDALVTVHSRHRQALFGNELHERYVVERLDGPARLLSEQHWHGLGAESLRAMLVRMDDEQLALWALGRYERRHPGLEVEGAPEVQHETATNRLTVRARYRLPRAVQVGDAGHALRWSATNLLGAFVLPESLSRRLPLSVPAYPGRLRYSVEVHWPDDVGLVRAPARERHDGEHFQLERTHSARGPVCRHTLELLPLVAAVPADRVPALAEDLRRVDALLHGASVVPLDAVDTALPHGENATNGLDAGAAGDRRRPTLRQREERQLRLQAERAARAIARGHLQAEDLAHAHALRAQALCALGDGPAAWDDAEQAVRHAPALPEAWAAQGQVHWALGRFDEAARAFGRALQLDGDPFVLHLQRGQARFYAGHFAAASDDFSRAVAAAVDEPSRLQALMWQGWASRRQPDAAPTGASPGPALDAPPPEALRHAAWPGPALGLQAGWMSPQDVLGVAAQAPGDAREAALTEAWFSVGQHHLLHGRHEQAREAFVLARQSGGLRQPEAQAAAVELRRLDERR